MPASGLKDVPVSFGNLKNPVVQLPYYVVDKPRRRCVDAQHLTHWLGHEHMLIDVRERFGRHDLKATRLTE